MSRHRLTPVGPNWPSQANVQLASKPAIQQAIEPLGL